MDPSSIKIVSFDAEGTLVTPDFSAGMWYECVPEAYGRRHGLSFEEARKAVAGEYDRVGDGRLEWYDVRYWFERFDLGDYQEAFQRCQSRIKFYPEANEVLKSVHGRYKLIVLSASVREFLDRLMVDVAGNFDLIVSSISDYQDLKSPEFYAKICQELGVQPEEMVHVGDSRQYDFLNARAAGLNAFHLDRPGDHKGEGAVRSLEEFSRMLLNSPGPSYR